VGWREVSDTLCHRVAGGVGQSVPSPSRFPGRLSTDRLSMRAECVETLMSAASRCQTPRAAEWRQVSDTFGRAAEWRQVSDTFGRAAKKWPGPAGSCLPAAPDQSFSESVALSSASANRPSASGLAPFLVEPLGRSFDLIALRARCKRERTTWSRRVQVARRLFLRNLRKIMCGTRSRRCPRLPCTDGRRTSRSTRRP
jgi:hypothetical protein